MAGVNKIILLGNLGKDPELKYAQSSGKAVCRFSLAVNEKRGGEEQTEWFNIVAFDRTAEIADQFLAKGRPVYIEGRLKVRKYTDKDGNDRYQTEILASNLCLLGGGISAEKAPQGRQGDDLEAGHRQGRTGQNKMGFDGRDARSRPAEDDPFAGDFGPPPSEEELPF